MWKRSVWFPCLSKPAWELRNWFEIGRESPPREWAFQWCWLGFAEIWQRPHISWLPVVRYNSGSALYYRSQSTYSFSAKYLYTETTPAHQNYLIILIRLHIQSSTEIYRRVRNCGNSCFPTDLFMLSTTPLLLLLPQTKCFYYHYKCHINDGASCSRNDPWGFLTEKVIGRNRNFWGQGGSRCSRRKLAFFFAFLYFAFLEPKWIMYKNRWLLLYLMIWNVRDFI